VPLTHRLLGASFERLHDLGLSPAKSFGVEFGEHPFTHVDVVTVLARRWKFPDVLAKPIAWHHSPPAPRSPRDAVHTLHRIAYYSGAMELRPDGKPLRRTPLAEAAEVHLGLEAGHIADIVGRATREYDGVLDLFSDVADSLEATYLAAAVHQQLVDVLDEQMASEFADSSRPREQQFRLGGLTLMLRPDADGLGTAYTYDSRGDPLSTYRFIFASETVHSLREALGLESHEGDDVDAISEYLQKVAA
jgi:hypothetical protein